MAEAKAKAAVVESKSAVVAKAAAGVDTTKDLQPYSEGNVSPRAAKGLKADVAARLLARAKRPLLVVGGRAQEPEMLRRAIAIGKAGLPIAATGGSVKAFLDAKYNNNVYAINLNELTARLRDRAWTGFDGKGNYDVVAFFGHTHYYANQFLSTLKNFVPEVCTLCVDRFYCINADFSFGNLPEQEFYAATDDLIANIKTATKTKE